GVEEEGPADEAGRGEGEGGGEESRACGEEGGSEEGGGAEEESSSALEEGRAGEEAGSAAARSRAVPPDLHGLSTPAGSSTGLPAPARSDRGTTVKIVKSNEAAWADSINKGRSGQRRKELGSTGKLAAGLWELLPGRKSFPFHMHHVTEEALFVISGNAKVRTPDGLTPISAGDWVMFPPGDCPHQLVNDGSEPMVYIAFSVASGVDVVEYPDSGKLASSIGSGAERKRFIFKKGMQVEYFADE